MHLPLSSLRWIAWLWVWALLLEGSLRAAEPSVDSTRPAEGAVVLGAVEFFDATLVDGDTAKVAGVTLQLDGRSVDAQFVKTAGGATVKYGPYAAFANPGSVHIYTLMFTDTAVPSVTRTQTVTFRFSYSELRPNPVFIEAEDFNFSHGETDRANPIGMNGAYPGGTFQDKGDGLLGFACDGSDFGVDYFQNHNGSDQQVYRPNTAVEAGKFNGSSGVARGTFDVQVNHVVGWSAAGEWMNYTRTFPSFPNVYRVYARMSHGDAAQRRGGVLYRVTSDPSTCNQTMDELGRFSAPWTGGWDEWPDTGTEQDALIPMKNANGEVSYIVLGGDVTLRWQFEEGGGDLDYLVFGEEGHVDYFPRLDVVQPTERADPSGVLDASVAQGDVFFLKSETVTVTLDGVVVPAEVKNLGAKTTFRYAPLKPFAAGSSHMYMVSAIDSFGIQRLFQTRFTITFTPLPAGTLFIEAEDFNFGHGNTISDRAIGMTGAYEGAAFFDKGNGGGGVACGGSDFGIDYMESNGANEIPENPLTENYRAHTGVEASKLDGLGLGRGTFNVRFNHVVGWTDASEWLNYTRTFPENGRYRVFALMAHGQENGRRGGKLFKVTSDPSVCDQTVELLGTFSAPWTGGWDTWPDAGNDQDALIPMKDATGATTEVALSGVQTLRFQFTEDAGNFDYLAFVPAPPKVSASASAGGTAIVFEGVLESAGSLPGIFQPVPGAISPYTPSASKEKSFFRSRR